MCADLTNMAADHLANPDARGPGGYVRDMVDWVREETDRLVEKVNRGHRLVSTASRLSPGDEVRVMSNHVPVSDDGPLVMGARVTGGGNLPNPRSEVILSRVTSPRTGTLS